MFKAIILLRRNPTDTSDGFRQWWLQEHAPLARQLPGVRKAVFNLVDPDEVDAENAYDGVSELWFDSREAFDAAYASEIGQTVAQDSLAHVAARVRMLVSEHEIVS